MVLLSSPKYAANMPIASWNALPSTSWNERNGIALNCQRFIKNNVLRHSRVWRCQILVAFVAVVLCE
jgi:hypothetical protein